MKRIRHIISLSHGLRSINYLLQILYVIAKSGDWDGWEPLVRVAMHQGRGEGRLPMELTSADVEGVGSRAVYDSRCEALRQLSLIGRHIGMTLERVNNGEERLGGRRLTIHTPQTLPANHPFRNYRFDDGDDYASVRDAVLDEMHWGGSEVAHQRGRRLHGNRHVNATRFYRLRQLATQQPPIWGCRTISTNHCPAAGGLFYQVIVLHGDQPHHTFEAHFYIYSDFNYAGAYLHTTERPVAGREGAARFPLTVRVAR